MHFWKLAALLLPLSLLPFTAASAQPAESRPQTGNAAVQYWQAFALMPTLSKDQEELLEKWNEVSLDDEEVKKLIVASQTSLMYLHRGAAMKDCDWGLKYGDGISMLMPHLSRCRDLARLAALRARHEFERGNWKLGRNDATAIVMLGRHVGREPILIARLVGFLIEDAAIDLVAPYVLEHKAPYAEALAMYKALPATATLADSLMVEKKHMAQWMIDKLQEEEKRMPGAGLALWKNFIAGAETEEQLKQFKSVDEIVEQIEAMLPIYDELARIVALPKSEFEAQYPKFKEEKKTAQPIVGLLLPAVDKVLAKEHRNRARFALLFAAIAVAESGMEKLKDIKDPYGDGPFEYRPLDKGFELKSKLIFEDKPVALTFGQGKQG